MSRSRKLREQAEKAEAREAEKCRMDDFCKAHGFTYREMSPYQYRIEEEIDIYPTSRKYCLFSRGSWGQYQELEELLKIIQK